MPDGYGFDPGALETVTKHLGTAEEDLTGGIQGVPSIDAGRSTDWVAGVLDMLVEAGAGISAVTGQLQAGVDASNGSYKEVDENNRERLITNDDAGMKTWQNSPPPPQKQDSGPLMDDPDGANPPASTEKR